MVYRGQVKGNRVVLEKGVRLPDGARVRVEIENVPPSERGWTKQDADRQRDALMQMMGICRSGRKDGSENHDHYIYGIPKRKAKS